MTTDAVSAQRVPDIDVCVCTYRRASVAETLASIGRQLTPPGFRIRVIVADNDTSPSARARVEAAFAAHGLNGVYIHAPAQNISVARNACLDAVQAPLAAFIDDDETARLDWIACLVRRQAATGADVVFGQVQASYSLDAPRWMRRGDLHSTRPFFRGGEIEGGYTCNVLFRMDKIGQRRFNPALGRSGGEDTAFFTELQLAGARLEYAADAVVDEPVPDARSSLGWLLKRSFRSGQTHGQMLVLRGGTRVMVATTSVLKVAACALLVVVAIWSPERWRKSAVRGALHAGALAAALGKAPLQLYG